MEIAPLHSSLDNRVRLSQNKRKKKASCVQRQPGVEEKVKRKCNQVSIGFSKRRGHGCLEAWDEGRRGQERPRGEVPGK